MFEFGIMEKIKSYSEIDEVERHISENDPTKSVRFIEANTY
jgi:hypothetical protein